jgi:hypothetical protein
MACGEKKSHMIIDIDMAKSIDLDGDLPVVSYVLPDPIGRIECVDFLSYKLPDCTGNVALILLVRLQPDRHVAFGLPWMWKCSDMQIASVDVLVGRGNILLPAGTLICHHMMMFDYPIVLPEATERPDYMDGVFLQNTLREKLRELHHVRNKDVLYRDGVCRYFEARECACEWCTDLAGCPCKTVGIGPVCVPVLDARTLPAVCETTVWCLWASRFCGATSEAEFHAASDAVRTLWDALGPGQPPKGLLVRLDMMQHYALPCHFVFSTDIEWECPGRGILRPYQAAAYLEGGMHAPLKPATELSVLLLDEDTRARMVAQNICGPSQDPLTVDIHG